MPPATSSARIAAICALMLPQPKGTAALASMIAAVMWTWPVGIARWSHDRTRSRSRFDGVCVTPDCVYRMPRTRTRIGAMRWNQTVGLRSQPKLTAALVTSLVMPEMRMLSGPSVMCEFGRTKLRLRAASSRLTAMLPACVGSRTTVLAESTVTGVSEGLRRIEI